MRVDDFFFELPPEQIAQRPAAARDRSRLMVLDRAEQRCSTGAFSDLPGFFKDGDVLVLNETRVFPARLLGAKETGGKVEALLVRRLVPQAEEWLCMVRSSKPLRPGSVLTFDESLSATVVGRQDERHWRLRFRCPGDIFSCLERVGHVPLPPYIRRPDTEVDRSRYQTVFAQNIGSVAAPTAGLHFTPEILSRLSENGVEICYLTLHVGPGTFMPVQVEDPSRHRMHSEYFSVPEKTAQSVNRARSEGRRVIAVGTTTTRTLEYYVNEEGVLRSGEGETDLFIYPGFKFRIVDALVTNFHLPKSTLLMLVSAFGGREFVLDAYRRAVAAGFRFFSYGDCMLIY